MNYSEIVAKVKECLDDKRPIYHEDLAKFLSGVYNEPSLMNVKGFVMSREFIDILVEGEIWNMKNAWRKHKFEAARRMGP
ncbi:hypothetical protein LCGC14_0338610 [marine sediment metagenome]|uniref:Uncharacterized protein n=1 Tax=marine sediment metagenome TaxID=412755 RepID=A0A0F9TXH3_9ZZZZ